MPGFNSPFNSGGPDSIKQGTHFMQEELTHKRVIRATRHWLEAAVIGLNLCPFAKSVHIKKQIRFVVSDAHDVESLYRDLINELRLLKSTSPDELDTTLLIHPWVLSDFMDYNDFLDIAEATVVEEGLDGEIQIASFHPDYEFADVPSNDISNFTNRSPFPILHLLREASIDRAVAAFPDASMIFEKNIETMHRLGAEGWNKLLEDEPLIPMARQVKDRNRT